MMLAVFSAFLAIGEPGTILISSQIVELIKELSALKQKSSAQDETLQEIRGTLQEMNERLKRIEDRVGVSRPINPSQARVIKEGLRYRPLETTPP